jgi:hypothetical protein
MAVVFIMAMVICFPYMTIDHNIVFNGVTNNEADGLPAGQIVRALRNIFLDFGSENGNYSNK